MVRDRLETAVRQLLHRRIKISDADAQSLAHEVVAVIMLATADDKFMAHEQKQGGQDQPMY